MFNEILTKYVHLYHLCIAKQKNTEYLEDEQLCNFISELHCLSCLEPSYPKVDPTSAARRSWELRNFICQSKGLL